MAGIAYNPVFEHEDWIDNEDVVQAGGEKGFNKKFHAIEDEFDEVSKALSNVDVEIEKIQRLEFLHSHGPPELLAGAVSEEFSLGDYSRDGLPHGVERPYFIAIFPESGPTHVQHTILYREIPGNRVMATVQFFNPGTAAAKFSYSASTLSIQP